MKVSFPKLLEFLQCFVNFFGFCRFLSKTYSIFCQELLRNINECAQSKRDCWMIFNTKIIQELSWTNQTGDWLQTITNNVVTLRYFTGQTMTQEMQNADTGIKMVTQHFNIFMVQRPNCSFLTDFEVFYSGRDVLERFDIVKRKTHFSLLQELL